MVDDFKVNLPSITLEFIRHLLHYSGPVYTGLEKFLHSQILFLDRLFTWILANSVTDCSGVYMDPCK